jgi:polyhydroxybutyrate depolymerase
MRTTTRWVAAVAAAATVLLGACGDDDDSAGDGASPEAPAGESGAAPDEPPADPASIEAAPSAGCDAATPVAADPAGEERVTTESGGQERWYLRRVPESHDGRTPLPLVLDLHGYSEGAEVHVAMSGLGDFGESAGFVTLTPHGLGAVPRWDTALDGADVAFVGDLLDEAEATLCVDTNRVYVTGLSNGAFMTSAVACRYADRVAAVAPVAGVRDVEGCDPARPVPVVAFHGTADEFVTYDGGRGDAVADLPAPDGSGRTLGDLQESGDPPPEAEGPSVPEIMAAWAERNGCEPGEPAPEDVSDDTVVLRHECPAGAEAELYRVEGGGHAWPGSEFSVSIEQIVGPTTMTISANEVMWDFFTAHPMPPDADSAPARAGEG